MSSVPSPPRATLERAIAHHRRGQLVEARALYGEVLATEPRNFDALHLLGTIAAQTGSAQEALGLLTRAIEIDPGYAAAHFNRGLVLRSLGQSRSALASHERAIAIDPNFAAAHFDRATLLEELHDPIRALASYDQAIRSRPGYFEALLNRATLLAELGRLTEALASFDLAIAAAPQHAPAYSNRANVLRELGHWERAVADCKQALELEPTLVQAHVNLGALLRSANRLDEAIASYDKAIALRPDFAIARENRGYASLLAGDYANGWVDHEWRWKNELALHSEDARHFSQPLWLGKYSIAERTILLHGEAGLGDTIQFCRYAKLVAELGARVILEVQRPLVNLLASLEGVEHVIARGDALPEFSCYCPLMSLPLAFDTTLSTIPARNPYLRASKEKVRFWRDRLGERSKLRVGLVWSGGSRVDRLGMGSVFSRRNIPLKKLAALRHPGIAFYSLQKGQPAESELANLISDNWEGPDLADFAHLLYDFSDTAALVENLDLVISVDTSTAHLAGALGKPVWIMNRFDGCWRWLLDRSDSPWYPSVRLYRQERPGDWDGVVEQIASDLARFVSSPRTNSLP